MIKKLLKTQKAFAQRFHPRRTSMREDEILLMCRKCYSFKYENEWHFEKPDYLLIRDEEKVPVQFSQCPACVEESLAMYDMEYV
jgi:hypothetical protein